MKTIDTNSKGYKKFRKIAALVGVILLVGLAITALIASFFDSEYAYAIFLTAIYGCFIIPIIIYLISLYFKIIHGKKDEDK